MYRGQMVDYAMLPLARVADRAVLESYLGVTAVGPRRGKAKH